MNYFAPSIALVGGNFLLLVRSGVFYNLVYNITVLKFVFFLLFFCSFPLLIEDFFMQCPQCTGRSVHK